MLHEWLNQMKPLLTLMVSNDSSHASNYNYIIFAVADHLVAQNVAIKMLHSRVKLVLDYVKAVSEGELKPNQEILREAFTLSHRLPVVQNLQFKEEFHTQSNDVGLIMYLGTLTKAANDINQLVNKFNLLHDRQSRRMRFFF